MNSLIRWSVSNSPAMNTIMLGVLSLGALSMYLLNREVFPEFELEIVLVTVPYPGASPSEVEEGICQKIEEAVQSIDGIKKMTSVAKENSGSVVLELEAGEEHVQKILSEVRSAVDQIPSFPLLAEDPNVRQVTFRQNAIRVAVIGPDLVEPGSRLALRDLTEQVRTDLLQLGSVTQAELDGAPPYQIDIEIPESTLRKHGLSLADAARIVRRENIELPGGTLKTDAQEVLLRGKNRRLVGQEIDDIPLVTQPGGLVLTVGDLGLVRDEFSDVTSVSQIDGKPGLVINVQRTSDEDLLSIVHDVREYALAKQLPPGYELRLYDDQSIMVRDRLEMLGRNGLQGLVLVFLVLGVFLELRLAFWVALGIPISILGAAGVLMYLDQTLNMLTMFAFLMALGIVVDDAIVIGENIYAHREMGKPPVQAAIDGAVEVLPSVGASVATTVLAFVPMMFVTGVMGKFIAVLPLAMIAMLLISLLESTFVLPCHLAHVSEAGHGHNRGGLFGRCMLFYRRLWLPLRWTIGPLLLVASLVAAVFVYPFAYLGHRFAAVNQAANRGLTWFIENLYVPFLERSLRNPVILMSAALAMLVFTVGFIPAGITPWTQMPKLDSNVIMANITFPDGTPATVTNAATSRIEAAIRKLDAESRASGGPLLHIVNRYVGSVGGQDGPGQTLTEGSHVGRVQVELVDTSERELHSEQVLGRWREIAGEFPGIESLKFQAQSMGPGASAIEFKLLGADVEKLQLAADRCKVQLAQYPGVFDIADDNRPGKWELQLSVKPKAQDLGVTASDLAETVRSAYYGEEVMRLQRGRHEVKLMVRYPYEDRRSLAGFDDLRVRTADGVERRLTELAEIKVERGPSEINRVDQLRSITVTADLDESIANASQVVSEMQANFAPGLLAEFPGVRIRWEGQAEQSRESLSSLFLGFAVALIAMFVLLTVEFRSYAQPLLILMIIPFGIIGAIWGHALMGLPLTMFSVFGLVALTGVVINDSIVLVDFVNHRLADGLPLDEALIDAGRRRFRPVLLTSLTTVAGLLPILVETSFQAQIVIPMATSLAFGLMVGTALVLVLVPTSYSIYGRLTAPAEPPAITTPAEPLQAVSH